MLDDALQLVQCTALYEVLVLIEEAEPEEEEVVAQDVSHVLGLRLGEDRDVSFNQVEM